MLASYLRDAQIRGSRIIVRLPPCVAVHVPRTQAYIHVTVSEVREQTFLAYHQDSQLCFPFWIQDTAYMPMGLFPFTHADMVNNLLRRMPRALL